MGNGYNHHLPHQNMHLQHKATFLPILCSRPSIKDVTLPKWKDRSGSFSDDPLSPKISCMGQVKRKNRVVGFPAITSHKFTITTKNNGSSNSIKYFKLRKLFSGKNILTGSPATAVSATATSCRRRDLPRNDGGGKENSASINIENMDPPLPVIKRVPKQGDHKGDGDTLWKRRSNGVALRNLQLQQIQLNSN